MKHIRFNQVLSLLVALCLLVTVASAAVPTEELIQPRYANITRLAAGLTISPSDYARCTGYVRLSNSSDTVNLTIELQRSTDKSTWSTIKDWSSSGSYAVELDKGWYVMPGYYHRVAATAQVYDSSGKLIETATAYSDIV